MWKASIRGSNFLDYLLFEKCSNIKSIVSFQVQELKIPSCSQEEVIVETNEDFESFNIDYNTSDIAEIDILSNNSVEVPNLISYGVDLPRECSETPGKDPKFICEYCGNAYHKKDSLKQHLLTHQVYPSEKRRIHKCFHCDAEFYYFSTYKIHINNVHNQNRPYQCHLCEKSYKKKDSLDQHVLMHQNRRKYRCPTCNSSFNRNSDLKYHMRVHGERNLYTCHLCEAKYVSLANLKLHLITIHEGKRPWTCQNCTNAFRTKATMLKHTKAMTCVKKME